MADMFFQSHAQNLLKKKNIVFFGDSNARAMYKDLVWLLNQNLLIEQSELQRKQEDSFCGDRLGQHSELSRGREYEEERFYEKDGIKIEFYFITRCFNPRIIDIMEDISLGLKPAPDVIFLNSTLWDVSRWGPNGVIEFKDNLMKLARLMKNSLPSTTLVIWATALPVSSKVQSSLLVKQIDFLKHTLRFDVMEANNYARQVMVNHGFDVLDNHYYMRFQIHRRVKDGVHYFPTAIRFLTNLLLTHIALSWDVPLPGKVKTLLLDKAKALCGGTEIQQEEKTTVPPTPPHLLLKDDKKDEKGGKNEKEGKNEKGGKNVKERKNEKGGKKGKKSNNRRNYWEGRNNRRNKGMKPQKPWRQTVHQRSFQNYNPTEKRLYQQRRMKGGNRRDSDWRREEPPFRRWSETPTPATNPWMNAQLGEPPRWSGTSSPMVNPWINGNNTPWDATAPSTSSAHTWASTSASTGSAHTWPSTSASTSSAHTNWSEDRWPVGQGFGAGDRDSQFSVLSPSAQILARAQVQQRQTQRRYPPY